MWEEDPSSELYILLCLMLDWHFSRSASPYYPHKFVMYCRCLHLTACPLQEKGGDCCFYCFFFFFALSLFFGVWDEKAEQLIFAWLWFWGADEQQRAWGCKTFVHLLSSSGDLDIMRQLGARNLESCSFPWIEVSVQFVVSPHFWCTKYLGFVTMTALSNLVPPLFLKTNNPDW